MDLSDQIANVRLKFFLARQAEGRRSGANRDLRITRRPAGILAALALMERYSGTRMTGNEVRRLLGLSGSGLGNPISVLKSKSLVKKDGPYYRINDQGLRALVQFSDDVLGTPASVWFPYEPDF